MAEMTLLAPSVTLQAIKVDPRSPLKKANWRYVERQHVSHLPWVALSTDLQLFPSTKVNFPIETFI